MTPIGFDAASIGAMAAVYAVVVPILEVPSGILADRWSRRGVLILASIAGILSVLLVAFGWWRASHWSPARWPVARSHRSRPCGPRTLTAPLLLAATVVLLWLREPRLHQVEERQPLRRQVATTDRTILARGQLRAVVALAAVGSVLMLGMPEPSRNLNLGGS